MALAVLQTILVKACFATREVLCAQVAGLWCSDGQVWRNICSCGKPTMIRVSDRLGNLNTINLAQVLSMMLHYRGLKSIRIYPQDVRVVLSVVYL